MINVQLTLSDCMDGTPVIDADVHLTVVVRGCDRPPPGSDVGRDGQNAYRTPNISGNYVAEVLDRTGIRWHAEVGDQLYVCVENSVQEAIDVTANVTRAGYQRLFEILQWSELF